MYENQTYEKIKSDILSKINNIDKREGSFINDMVSPVSMELEGAYNQLEVLLSAMFLKDIGGEMLDKRAEEYGIKRKLGTKSVGKVTFTGISNTVIPKGSLVATNSNILFKTSIEVIIPTGETKVLADIVSTEIGSKNNVLTGSIVNIPSSINGITTVYNETETFGGTDKETDDSLLKRVLHLIQNSATSGNKAHYKMWALEVNGVGDAKVFPTHYGNGTVLVLPITSEKQAPTDDVVENIKTYIESKRPIGAKVTVLAPNVVSVNVSAEITLDGTKTLEDIKKQYEILLKKYITDSVFKIYVVDYFRCLSLFYDIEGVKQVNDVKLNGGNSNITVNPLEIQSVGTITITQGGI